MRRSPPRPLPHARTRSLAGSWLTIRRARLREAGDFLLDRALPPGTYRATIKPTGGLTAAYSPPIRVR